MVTIDNNALVPTVIPPIIPPTKPVVAAPMTVDLSKVSSAVAGAVNKTLATGYTPPASTSSFGSSAGITMGSTLNSSLDSASTSLTPLYDTKTGFLTPAGVAAGSPVVQPNDPSKVDNTKFTPVYNTDGTLAGHTNASGTFVPYLAAGAGGYNNNFSTPTTIPNSPIGTGLTNPDGSQKNNPAGFTYSTTGANPALVPTYTQANDATNTVNAQYQSDLAAQQRALQANIDQLKLDKENAVAAATKSYAANNPEGGGSDKDSYLSEIGSKYDDAISNATYDMQTELTNLSIAHQSSLDNIKNQVTNAVSTFNTNTYNAGLSTLTSLAKGNGSALSPIDNATLISQLTAGGATPQQAQLQIDSAIAQAKTAQSKTLTTEQRQERSAAITALNGSLSRITDSQSASQDPTIINQVLAAGYVGDPIGYDTNGNPAYTDSQRQQASQYILGQNIKPVTTAANIAFRDASLAERYKALAQAGALSDATKITNLIESYDTTQLGLTDQVGLATLLHQTTGIPQSTAEKLIASGALKNAPTTTTTTTPNVLSKVTGGTTTKEVVKGNSTTSSSTSSVPSGYYQASDGNYYPNQ